MKRRTITESRRLEVCLECGARPAVADGTSLAQYSARCHSKHAAKWREKKENE